MHEPDYVYTFTDIKDTVRHGKVVARGKGRTEVFEVSVDDWQLSKATHRQMLPVAADLVDLAIAIHVADRLSTSRQGFSRQIYISLPVRHPEVFRRPEVIHKIGDTLFWFTGDRWEIEFVSRSTSGRTAESQMGIPLTLRSSGCSEIALWSGGLDSLAGLWNRLVDNPEGRYTLFGTGANRVTLSVQQRVIKIVNAHFPGRVSLVQVPIRFDHTTQLPKNSILRARGFTFLLLGAVCANMEGQTELCVYENGIGAINLPFRASEVGWDHSRSVHPLSLAYVAELVSEVLGQTFAARNPFLFWTKAQMCQALTRVDAAAIVAQTASCDSPRRESPSQTHCGCCSSCLLRRQALLAQGIDDRTPYLMPNKCSPKASDLLHLRAMLAQVDSLQACLNSEAPWFTLSDRYPDLSGIVDHMTLTEDIAMGEVERRPFNLYDTYVREWTSIRDIVERQFFGASGS